MHLQRITSCFISTKDRFVVFYFKNCAKIHQNLDPQTFSSIYFQKNFIFSQNAPQYPQFRSFYDKKRRAEQPLRAKSFIVQPCFTKSDFLSCVCLRSSIFWLRVQRYIKISFPNHFTPIIFKKSKLLPPNSIFASYNYLIF